MDLLIKAIPQIHSTLREIKEKLVQYEIRRQKVSTGENMEMEDKLKNMEMVGKLRANR